MSGAGERCGAGLAREARRSVLVVCVQTARAYACAYLTNT